MDVRIAAPPLPVRRLRELGQSIWLDEISRPLIESGKLGRLVEDWDVTGLTSNPTIFARAIADGTAYESQLRELLADGVDDPEEAYLAVTATDIQRAADVLRPAFDRTDGHDGFVSIEVPPDAADDTARSVAMAHRLWERVARPNLMVKIPATEAGVPAIRRLLVEGLNVNITLLFSLDAYGAVARAYIEALRERRARGLSLDVRSVASFFVSRVDTAVDTRLRSGGDRAAATVDLRGRAAIANARLAYEIFSELGDSEEFRTLRAAGASPQRLLWASTSTKDPALSDVHYVEELIGPDTINTMPRRTLEAFADHGRVAGATVASEPADARWVMARLAEAGVEMSRVTDELLRAGLDTFRHSYDEAVAVIRGEMRRISR